MPRDGGHWDPTPPRGVTGTSCGDLLADKSRELCFPWKKGGINAKNMATHFDDAGTAVHEGELGRIMKITTQCLGLPRLLCAFAPLSLLPDLNGLSHRRDLWSSAGLEQPEQGPISRVATLLSRARPLPCAMR